MLRGDPEGLDTTSFAAFRIRFLISEHIGLGWVDFIFLHRFRHHERRRLTAFAMFFRSVRASIEIVQYNSMFSSSWASARLNCSASSSVK